MKAFPALFFCVGLVLLCDQLQGDDLTKPYIMITEKGPGDSWMGCSHEGDPAAMRHQGEEAPGEVAAVYAFCGFLDGMKWDGVGRCVSDRGHRVPTSWMTAGKGLSCEWLASTDYLKPC